MKLATVRQRIGAIRRAAKAADSETAHRLEDRLRADVLTAISTMDAEDPVAMAALAMSTSHIRFSRWCA